MNWNIDGNLNIYDLKGDYLQISKIPDHALPVRDLEITSNQILSASEDEEISVIDMFCN